MPDLIPKVKNFIEVYIDDSVIESIQYINKSKQWKISFNDKTKLEFSSFEEMLDWLHADQFGD